MNTEAMNTLKLVREVITTLQVDLNDPALTRNERDLLEAALLNMNEMENIIINNILQDMVDKINSSNQKLKRLIEDMKASTERIARFSNTVKRISDVVGVLAKITSKAMSVGIL